MTLNRSKIGNWINGIECDPVSKKWLARENPASGEHLYEFANSGAADADAAIAAAQRAFPSWSSLTPVRRGQILYDVAARLRVRKSELVQCIARETGKPPADARAEVEGAIMQADFFAGEGMRLYARTLTSGMPDKHSATVREPIGVAALIVPANTPIANIAWKVFPALICGNTAVLKAAEDAPLVACLVALFAQEAGLPDGVLNVLQGDGLNAGAALVEDERIGVISFTGSTTVGRRIASVAGQRLARLSLELGGANSMVVCDDADLDQAVHWATLSAFSNAGQRCAAGRRLIVFRSIYDEFRDRLVEKAKALTLGVHDGANLGPVMNRRLQQNILAAIRQAVDVGGTILCGGKEPTDPKLTSGFYVEPTLIEGVGVDAQLSCEETFGPVAVMHAACDLPEALAIANSTKYGLTAAIHTRSVDRATWFSHRVRAGVVNVNIGTYGSEPHMPFGGFGASGNGSREPGVEALDVYSELKNISTLTRGAMI